MDSIILGIDPGSQVAGFGVIRLKSSRYFEFQDVEHLGHGIIRLGDSEKNFSSRLATLGQSMKELIQKYKPTDLSIEKIFLGKNADSAFKLGHSRGVVLYEATVAGCEVYEYATRSVKKGITGRGAAEKEDVRAVLEVLLKLGRIQHLDASDALALACYHSIEMKKQLLYNKRFNEL